MEYPEIDAFSSLDSAIHHLDPRAKIISFTFLIFSFAFVDDLKVASFALLFSFFVLLLSKLPIDFALKRIKIVFFLLFPLMVIMPLTMEGNELIGVIPFSLEGFVYSSLIVVRAIATVILALIMLATTRFDMTMKALYALRIPGILVQMLMFTYRYIFVITDEFTRMWKSMECKGFKLSTNLHGLSILGNILGMLIIKSYDRTSRVYQSMVSKGYDGKPKSINHFEMAAKDYVLSICMVMIAIFVHTYQLVLL